MIKFSIIITTKNRLSNLEITLNTLKPLLLREDTELLICDDSSIDGTQEYLTTHFAHHTLIFNTKSLGLIHNRNALMNSAKGNYIISLDDDANFITESPLEQIEDYFVSKENCGVLSLRIFWGKEKPNITETTIKPYRVNSFVGCGHVWRKEAWNKVPEYPSWFVFYGEEDYASYYLFKKNIEIHYFPDVLVHHRVSVKERKEQKDYTQRLRRSLRAGWYLYVMFFPVLKIPRLFLYTLWVQIKNKVFKGSFRALLAIIGAILDLIINFPKLISNASRLTMNEYKEYRALPQVKIFWTPNER
jgi:glycosyltransferase involved in cell wall biosynthesis